VNKFLITKNEVQINNAGCDNCGEIYERGGRVISAKDYYYDIKHQLTVLQTKCRTCGAPLKIMIGKFLDLYSVDNAGNELGD
jgi:ribosomal protein S27AE